MNQFKIVATKYSEVGALTDEYQVFLFGTADMAKAKYDELKRMYQTDDEGNKTGHKVFKVELFTMTYKKVENVEEFFSTLL